MTDVSPEFIAWWIYDDVLKELFAADFGIHYLHVPSTIMKQFAKDLMVVLY